MIYSPIENQVSKRVSFPDVRPKVTHENFTWSNTWQGSLYHYYQDFVCSERFDLSTTLITADHMGPNANSMPEGFSFEIIDDAGGTIVRVWYRYNNKVEPTALRVKIVQGLSYVAYDTNNIICSQLGRDRNMRRNTVEWRLFNLRQGFGNWIFPRYV